MKTAYAGCLLATIALVVSNAAGTGLQTPATTAVIIGQVVDATSNQPVAEAIVTLTPAGAPGGAASPAARDAASRKVIADGSGHFVFAALPKGSYSITAMKPGYVTGAHGRLVPRGRGAPIDVADGERVVDARILIWRHAIIAGRVFDEAGEPVVGAQVSVRRRTSIAGRSGFGDGATLTTDDRGAYRAANLEPGRYVVGVPSISTTIPAAMIDGYFRSSGSARDEMQQALFAAAPTMTEDAAAGSMRIGDHLLQVDGRMPWSPLLSATGVPAVYASTYFPQASQPAEATIIALEAGEIRGAIDIQLRAVAARRVAGRLRSASGPVGVAAVHLFPASTPSRFGEASRVATTVADAAGTFVFHGVPEGTYELRVVKLPAMGPRTTQSAAIPSGPTLWAAHAVAVGRDDVDDLDVVLGAGVRLAGRIVFEGRPPAVPVQRLQPLLDALDRWLMPDQSEIVVAADGSFTSLEVPPGSYRFAVPTPTGWFLKSAVARGRDLADLPFELQENLTDIVVTISDRGARVFGAVRDEKSAPDPTAAIVLFPADPRQWVDFSPYARGIKDTRVDRSGAYAIGDLPAGEYFVIAGRQQAVDWSQPSFFESLGRIATRITLAEGEQRALDLRTTPIKWGR
jgi:protocatechuate 3,4-dioxygenase beta subunit